MTALALSLLLLVLPGTGLRDETDIFRLSDVRLKASDDATNWRVWSGQVRLGTELLAPAVIEETSKGNGTLRLANLELRVIDGHVDYDFYEPWFLYTFLVDLNSDGYRDLVVCGRVWETDDDCDCAVRWCPLVEVFRFDAAAGVLVPLLPQRLMRIDCLGY